MIDKLHIEPYDKEQPSEYADRLGIIYAKQVSVKHKKENGQFFTPSPIAKLMASFCDFNKSSVRKS
jgi:adenine-specific DNA-methyltransferase